MTKEEIIKAWFAIDELGDDNIHTEISSFQDSYHNNKKIFRAIIRFGYEYMFVRTDADPYYAMEKVIDGYSKFIIQNEHK